MTIGRLEMCDLRELWPKEAKDFTRWLAENLDILGEKLGLSLSLVSREAAAGPFSADILAEDGDGNPVIIENQLEPTDHDHLGKIITYMSNLDAKVAIWVTSESRPEHETAVHWLNEALPADSGVYLILLEAYRIEDSSPAPMFTLVAGPSLASKEIGSQKKELAERHRLRLEFWTELLERANRRSPLHCRVAPSYYNWLAAGAGVGGMSFSYVIRMKDARVELGINRTSGEENAELFDQLHAERGPIEQAFGGALVWDKQEGRKSCFVRYNLKTGGLADREKWGEVQEEMIDAMMRMEKALGPKMHNLKP
jgi:hypothetical protein